MRRVSAIMMAMLIAGAAYMWHLGYLGGPVFTDLRPAGAERPVAAVILSGDMGFETGMARAMADRLIADGIPVVGINMLTAFRRTRTPDDAAALVAAAIGRARAFSHGGRVVLIGESFGGDLLHVGLSRLPAGLRRPVALVALVVPAGTVTFRASPSEIFDFGSAATPALPTARLLTWAPTLCVQGADEKDSLCPALTMRNVTRVALPGGHPMHRDADALYGVLSRAIAATTHR